MNSKSPMRKLYDSKIFWMIISLAVSLAIWIYVTSVEGDEFRQTFRNVRVELVGEETLLSGRNLVITDLDLSTVTVDVTGPRRIVTALSSSDLVAEIDVSKLTRAAYTTQSYTVVYPDGVDKRNLTVNRKYPETVSFVVSQQTSKSVQVRGGFEGKPGEGYTAETPVFEPSTITVYGPENYLKTVDHAWVTFGRDVEPTSTYSVETGFVLRNASNEAVSTAYLSTSQDTVRATLPILEVKTVALGIDLIEGAGATSANTKLDIQPASVTLAGDSAILAGINRIVLDTLDLTDFVTTYKQSYVIPLDNQLRNITGVTEATVSAEIVGLETRTFKVTNISTINEPEGAEVQILSESIDVVLRGTAEDLAAVKAEDISAVADLSDYKDSVGSYMPSVNVYVFGLTDVGAVGENTISVEIRKA